MTMRVCVFGAGAIGGHIAARLAAGGADVGVVARGPHLAAMQASGLRVHGAGADLRVRVRASADPAELGPQDVVIVTVKAPALPQVAAGIAPLLGADTPVAFVINGIPWWYSPGQGGLWDAVGPARTVGGVVWSACTVTEPGVVELTGTRNRVAFGRPDGGESAVMDAVAAVLRAGGMDAEVTPRIRDAVWSKLLMNLATGPICVLTGTGPAPVLADPAIVDAIRAVVAEGRAVADAWGCTPTLDLDAALDGMRRSIHVPSIVQDLQLGRPMEIDAIYAAPLELARIKGVPTPALDLLVALAKVRARAAGLY